MYARKVLTTALLFTMFLSLFAALVGEPFEDGSGSEDIIPVEDLGGIFKDLRGTRGGSSNVNFLSRPLYGEAWDVFVVGNYAYVYAGFNLMVFDISDKSNPQVVGVAETYTYGFSIEIVGSYVYLADYYHGLIIFDISNPVGPVEVGSYQIESDTRAFDVSISGSYAYLALNINGIEIIDISNPTNPQFAGKYTDFGVNGISAVGSIVYAACFSDGIRIIDMSNPSSPLDLGYNDTVSAWGIDVFGDIAYVDSSNFIWTVDVTNPSDPIGLTTYSIRVDEVHVVSDVAYVASKDLGLTILDVSAPSNPNEIGSCNTIGYSKGVFQLGSYAYIADSECGLVIIDVSDPTHPFIEGSFYTGHGPEDTIVEGNFAYVADSNAGFWIFDVSDTTNPIAVINITTIDGNDISPAAVSLRGNYAYVADINDLYTINIADPINPIPEGSELISGIPEDIYLDWPYAYIPQYIFEEGVSIIDVSNPLNPNEIAFYDEVHEAMGVHVSNNYLYIADGSYGLNIVDVTDPSNPINRSTFSTPGMAIDVFIKGDYAYIADYDMGLRIADISNPLIPTYVADLDTNGLSFAVFVAGGLAYVADGREGLRVIDVTDPYSPSEVGYFNTTGYARQVFVYNSVAYVSTWGGGLYLLDVSILTSPQIGSTFPEQDSTDIPLGTNIIINFTESMDTNSVESAFSYTDGSYTWDKDDGVILWTNNDMTFTFIPNSALDYGVGYQVTIAHTAKDKDGSYFDGDGDGIPGEVGDDDYAWLFTTIPPPPQIISTFPEDGMQDIFINTDIIINFSKTMDTNSVESAFSYTDGVTTWYVGSGVVTWSNDNTTFTFTPGSDLLNGVQFWVNLSCSAMDTEGFLLDGDGDGTPGEIEEDNYTWEFTTEQLPPTVVSTIPEDGSTFVPLNASVIINFSKSMDKTSTENAFSYTDGVSIWTAINGLVTWSNEDRNMTFTPLVEFENEKTYTFTVAHTATDTEGEALDGDNDGIGGEVNEDDYTWLFITVPPPPRIISIFPEDGMEDVLVNANIIINFSKTMDTDSVESAFSYTDGVITWYAGSGDVTWNNDNTNFTFTPGSDLLNGVQFWVNLSYSAMDTDGILLDGDGDGTPGEVEEDNYTWEFTTIPSPPKIDSTIPQDGATFVLVDVSVIINFSHSMDKSSTQAAFSYTDGNVTFDSSYGLVTWSNDDRTMTFKPILDFENEKAYTFTIEHTATDINLTPLDGDNDGIGGEGIEDDYTWFFKTIPTPPTIVATYPEAGDQDVKVNTNIIILFSKSMDTTSVQNAFKYTDGITEWGTSDGIVTWTNMNKNFSFSPSSAFDNNIQYWMTITHTAMSEDGVFLDVDGDPTPGEPGEDDYTWFFTTIPLPPQIITTSPLPGATFVPINSSVTIEFSKRMDKSSTQVALTYTFDGITFGSTNGFVAWSNEDRTMTFTPLVIFQNEMVYIFKIEHTATDIDGIEFDGDDDNNGGEGIEDDYIWSFTTMPVPPKVVSITPKKNAIEVAINTSIEIIFTNSMNESSVEDAFTFTHEDTNLTWDAFDGDVSWDEDLKIMTFEPSFLLEHEKEYMIKIEATAKDIQGITLDGNRNKLPEGVDTDDYISYFTTIPEPPKVESVEPSDGLTDVAIDADIVITFDKSMNKGSTEKAFSYIYEGSIDGFDKSDGSIEWTNNDKMLTFDPDLDFEEGEKYTVTIEDSAKDADGIAFEGYEWSFTIKINSPPVLEVGGVHPEEGDTNKMFKFSIVYTDVDDDKPESIEVVIDDISWRMLESDSKDEDYTDGKNYEFEISLDEGDHKYHFEVSDEKHDVRFPAGVATKTVKVSAVEEELIFGFLEEEYVGMPTLICGPIGIIFIIAIIISLILIMRGGRPGEETMAFEPFEEAAPPFTFMPTDEEEIMSFTAFEEAPSLEEVKPVLIQCPECDQHLRVRAVTRPFMFPCSCGAKLILK